MCVCLVTQSCLALCDPMDCSSPESSVCGTSQARILKWVAIFSFRGSSNPGIKWGHKRIRHDLATKQQTRKQCVFSNTKGYSLARKHKNGV